MTRIHDKAVCALFGVRCNEENSCIMGQPRHKQQPQQTQQTHTPRSHARHPRLHPSLHPSLHHSQATLNFLHSGCQCLILRPIVVPGKRGGTPSDVTCTSHVRSQPRSPTKGGTTHAEHALQPMHGTHIWAERRTMRSPFKTLIGASTRYLRERYGGRGGSKRYKRCMAWHDATPRKRYALVAKEAHEPHCIIVVGLEVATGNTNGDERAMRTGGMDKCGAPSLLQHVAGPHSQVVVVLTDLVHANASAHTCTRDDTADVMRSQCSMQSIYLLTLQRHSTTCCTLPHRNAFRGNALERSNRSGHGGISSKIHGGLPEELRGKAEAIAMGHGGGAHVVLASFCNPQERTALRSAHPLAATAATAHSGGEKKTTACQVRTD